MSIRFKKRELTEQEKKEKQFGMNGTHARMLKFHGRAGWHSPEKMHDPMKANVR